MRFRRFAFIALAAGWPALAAAQAAEPPVLRVCAEPDQLPHSHRDGSGFENRIAQVLAEELGARLQTTWIQVQGRLIGSTLGARRCDLLVGVPAGFPRAATSKPYYRSSFVFVQPADEPPLTSLDDPRLSRRRIGVQRVGQDDAATPPAFVLAGRGDAARLVGFSAADGSVGERAVAALARGEIDLALLWGPQAGFYARRAPAPLQITPVPPHGSAAGLPMQVGMSLAVRADDRERLAGLEAALDRRRADIERILDEYGVLRQVDGGRWQ